MLLPRYEIDSFFSACLTVQFFHQIVPARFNRLTRLLVQGFVKVINQLLCKATMPVAVVWPQHVFVSLPTDEVPHECREAQRAVITNIEPLL